MTEELAAFHEDGKKGKEIRLELDRKSPPSVYYVNYRSLYSDNYPAKFDDELASFLISHYTDEGELVLDPFNGSGTIPLKAAELNRNAQGVDINPEATKLTMEKYADLQRRFKALGDLGIYNGDSRNMPFPDNHFDFILTSPPFGLTIDAAHDKYSDTKGDLANSEDYVQWRKGMKAVLKDCLRVLKPNRLCAVEIRPRSKDGHSYPLFSWIVQDAEELGFVFYTEYVEVVAPFSMWTYGKDKARKPFPMHSYVLIFQKPENGRLFQ